MTVEDMAERNLTRSSSSCSLLQASRIDAGVIRARDLLEEEEDDGYLERNDRIVCQTGLVCPSGWSCDCGLKWYGLKCECKSGGGGGGGGNPDPGPSCARLAKCTPDYGYDIISETPTECQWRCKPPPPPPTPRPTRMPTPPPKPLFGPPRRRAPQGEDKTKVNTGTARENSVEVPVPEGAEPFRDSSSAVTSGSSSSSVASGKGSSFFFTNPDIPPDDSSSSSLLKRFGGSSSTSFGSATNASSR